MPIDISNLPIELDGSPTWDQDLKGFTGRRQWLCAWADIKDPVNLASWVPLPYSSLFDTGSSLKCTKISAKPTPSANSGDYLVGMLTADYSTGDFQDGSPFRHVTGCVELLDVGSGKVFDDTSEPCGVPITMTMYSERLQVSFLRDYTSTLKSDIRAMVNKINNAEFEGYGTGCVRMEAPEYDDYINPGTGGRLLKITLSYNCLLGSYGHNYFYNPKTGVWTTTTPLTYQSTSFSGLF